MTEFVWVKTIRGSRTAGMFAFRGSDGKLYASDGAVLVPPSGSVMIFGGELTTAINKSAPKGMYVFSWKNTADDWYRYLKNEHLAAYATMDGAIAKIAGGIGVTSPHNSSKELIAEKKADVKAKKDMIELGFKECISTNLQLMKPMTVRALTRARAHPRPRAHPRAHPRPLHLT